MKKVLRDVRIKLIGIIDFTAVIFLPEDEFDGVPGRGRESLSLLFWFEFDNGGGGPGPVPLFRLGRGGGALWGQGSTSRVN